MLGDLISIARQNNKLNSGFVKQVLPQADILPPEEACNTYYMRFMVKDDPGVLRDLSGALAARILKERGYPVENAERCIRTLIARLHENADFPHEIGLFLGYPPEDVDGFIRNGARCAKCVGPWKVYGDEQAARCKFAQYRKCTNVYRDCLKKYNSFDRLVVAVS